MESIGSLLVPPKILYCERFLPPNSRRNRLRLKYRPVLISLGRQNQKLPLHRSLVVCGASNSFSVRTDGKDGGDFISKVLRENPCQVEPKFLVGERICTLREKEQLKETSFQIAVVNSVMRFYGKLYKGKAQDETGLEAEANALIQEKGGSSNPVYLKDILREFKGKLYVPEEMFKKPLSERETFDKGLATLPKMSFEECMRSLQSDKIKLLSSKRVDDRPFAYGYRDFIVELKEIPGDKRLQRTKWIRSMGAKDGRVATDWTTYNNAAFIYEDTRKTKKTEKALKELESRMGLHCLPAYQYLITLYGAG